MQQDNKDKKVSNKFPDVLARTHEVSHLYHIFGLGPLLNGPHLVKVDLKVTTTHHEPEVHQVLLAKLILFRVQAELVFLEQYVNLLDMCRVLLL